MPGSRMSCGFPRKRKGRDSNPRGTQRPLRLSRLISFSSTMRSHGRCATQRATVASGRCVAGGEGRVRPARRSMSAVPGRGAAGEAGRAEPLHVLGALRGTGAGGRRLRWILAERRRVGASSGRCGGAGRWGVHRSYSSDPPVHVDSSGRRQTVDSHEAPRRLGRGAREATGASPARGGAPRHVCVC
jgi:hypothetical protein